MNVEMNNVEQLLAQLSRDRFYGTLEIKLESGRVVLLWKTETIKPLATTGDYRDNRGRTNEHDQR